MLKYVNKLNFFKNKKENVVVIGMGYVGFPLACAIARNKKYNVYGLDLDKSKINKIKQKLSPIQDSQASIDIKTVKLNATTNSNVLKKAKYILICVPTPIDHNKNPDLTPVRKATQSIKKYLQNGQYIVLESTVNPGVCEECIQPILEEGGLKLGIDFELAHCPERINPGDYKWNVYNIPRNVAASTKEGTKVVADFYRSFIKAEVNEMSSIKAAESTKIVENTFRDINIAYVNELAKSFDKLGIDVVEVIKGASNKPFAFMPHFPGCGVGGHCIAVDPYYLIDYAAKAGFNHEFLKIARNVNNSMPKYTVDKLLNKLKSQTLSPKKIKVGVLGLSYKSNIADLRESPSFEIILQLNKLKIDVLTFDPYCQEESNATLNKILQECTAIIIATGHNEFTKIQNWGNVKIIVDGRNCLNKENITNQGIIYTGIGREGNIKEKIVQLDNKKSNIIYSKNFKEISILTR